MTSGHFTQWAAQFAVASELCKRGYEVAFTLGHNTPLADLMVISPGKQGFLVDVKGLSQKNPWLLKRKAERTDLFYVLAFVSTGLPNRFFILTQAEANQYVIDHLARPTKASRPRWDGFRFDAVTSHEDCWGILPQ